MAFLKITSPEAPERSVELSRHNTLGRHPDNTVQILDRIVSKNHCHIDESDGRFILKDLGSLNGTFINGERVDKQRTLSPGDEISLGATKIVFDTVAASPVETGEGDGKTSVVGRVTMSPGMVESHVRAKLMQAAEQHFVPERLVADVAALRRDYEKLRVSFELTRVIAGELDVDRLLEKILSTAFQLLPADRGVVLLLDAAGTLLPRCVRTKRNEGNEQVALSSTIINEVLRDRAAVLSSDALMDARFKGAQSIIMQGIRSSIAVPLIHSTQLLGVMVLDSQVAANAFSEKDLQLTQAFANQAAVAIQNGLFAVKIEKEALTRQRFQRLLSPAIAELVVSGEVEVEKGGRSRDVSVYFSDIRGFTAMSERKSAQEIVDMLNEYFELMVEVVFKHEGTLDKFVGDEIMALFGAPVAHDDDAYRAVKVAVEQMHALEEWNLVRVAEGDDPVQIGIGINSGDVVAGYLGSSKALEYTVIGDVVNTASRLCSVAQAGEVIISRNTYDLVSEYFDAHELSPTQVKGKAQALQVYKVLGEKASRRS
ncbi:MAG TPA: adenylate/guanylate cyclase domain-containing protein, partial [Polyangiales bacterium]|nr:adenylate/guanylate cyclase domain-containing protein [Polyangiales bacterium]